MYSLISMRTMLRSSSKSTSARVLASSVLPTPVGPRKIKEPMGRLGSLMPARARTTASLTAFTASSCPTTRWCRISSRCTSFSRSPLPKRATGMPVQVLTTLAISSSSTSSFSSTLSLPCSSLVDRVESSFCRAGKRPYFSSASLFKS